MARDSTAPVGSRRDLGLAACAFLALAVALAAQASAGGTPEYIAGDFAVGPGETQIIVNRTLVISGDIDVQTGGVLELRNATLLVNLSVNGSRSLHVAAGGTLRALDLDGLSQTTVDRSLIGSADPARRYVAHFAAASNVLFSNSALSGFGYSLVSPGLLIESDNVTFDGASLEAYVYLRVEAASPTFEGTQLAGDGTGSNYFFGSNSVLANCTLSRHFVALSAGNASNLSLTSALVRDSIFSFAANGSVIAVSDAIVNNSSSGVFLTNGSAARFTDVVFDAGAVAFGDNASVLAGFRQFVFRVVNLAADPVRNATVLVRSAANTTLASGNTAGLGSIGPVSLLAFTLNAGGRTDEPNATATAAKLANNTAVSFSPLTEPSPVSLAIASNIDPTVALLSPPSGTVPLAGEPVLLQVAAADPDATPGGLTISWRSSVQGPLGSGSLLAVPLNAGDHTIDVEARDLQEGFRRVTFNLSVEAGSLVASSTFDGGRWYNATMWKTSRGSFALTPYEVQGAPVLSFGNAVLFHATTGVLSWSYAVIAVPYDPAALPYGIDEANLTLAIRLDNDPLGQWVDTPGLVDTDANVIVVTLASTQGYGTLIPLGHETVNRAPLVTVPPTLVAVVGQAFLYAVDAHDTPGDALTYSLPAGSPWLTVDPASGAMSGTPQLSDRGLALIEVRVADAEGAATFTTIGIFVTGASVNAAPQLLNPRFTPASAVGASEVVIEVTYFDADNDFPNLLEVLIDGDPHTLLPVTQSDIDTNDGKAYAYRHAFAVGSHNISFRTSDGAPGRTDFVVLGAPVFVVAADSLRTLNNWFLALFVSFALTVAVYLYVRSRAPRKPPKKIAELPEDRATFLEGPALKRIPPQPAMVKKSPAAEAAVASGADPAAKVAHEGDDE